MIFGWLELYILSIHRRRDEFNEADLNSSPGDLLLTALSYRLDFRLVVANRSIDCHSRLGVRRLQRPRLSTICTRSAPPWFSWNASS